MKRRLFLQGLSLAPPLILSACQPGENVMDIIVKGQFTNIDGSPFIQNSTPNSKLDLLISFDPHSNDDYAKTHELILDNNGNYSITLYHVHFSANKNVSYSMAFSLRTQLDGKIWRAYYEKRLIGSHGYIPVSSTIILNFKAVN